jgi:hypothetical protein
MGRKTNHHGTTKSTNSRTVLFARDARRLN